MVLFGFDAVILDIGAKVFYTTKGIPKKPFTVDVIMPLSCQNIYPCGSDFNFMRSWGALDSRCISALLR